MNFKTHLRRLAPLSALVAVALLAVASGSPPISAVAGSAAAASPPTGRVLTGGQVFLNGRLANGSMLSFAPGDRLETGPRGSAIVTFSPTDGIALAEKTAVVLAAGPDGLVPQLERGTVLVRATHDRLRELRLSGDSISIRGEPGTARRFQVARQGDISYVVARNGSVTVHDSGYATTTVVPEGRAAEIKPEVAALEPPPLPPPQQRAPAGNRAGQISATIPTGYIVRGTDRSVGNRGDVVIWNDLMQTEVRGRSRIVLDDGSLLNVGSNSQLRIVQHNSQTQQTTLQLNYGRMRAQVVRLARPGAQFEVRTQTAVCGVLGTDFFIDADERRTIVVVFKGIVRVMPIAAAAAAVSLSAGQTTSASASSAATPATTSVAQVQSAINATQVSQVASSLATLGVVSRVALLTGVPPTVILAGTLDTFTEGPSPFQP